MADSAFDIVSEIDRQEMVNAVDQTRREISTRFDFKGSKSSLELGKEELTLISDDEGKLDQLIDVLHSKMIKRGLSLKALNYGKVAESGQMTVRQTAALVQGLDQDTSKKIHKLIKDSKLKVKSATMDQRVRVTAKSRDDLQQVIALLRDSKEITIPLQFTNYK